MSRRRWRAALNRTDTRGKCGRTSGDARVMDEAEAPLLSRVWRGRVLKGEFTETEPINNDPEVEASLFGVWERKNMVGVWNGRLIFCF